MAEDSPDIAPLIPCHLPMDLPDIHDPSDCQQTKRPVDEIFHPTSDLFNRSVRADGFSQIRTVSVSSYASVFVRYSSGSRIASSKQK